MQILRSDTNYVTSDRTCARVSALGELVGALVGALVVGTFVGDLVGACAASIEGRHGRFSTNCSSANIQCNPGTKRHKLCHANQTHARVSAQGDLVGALVGALVVGASVGAACGHKLSI